MKESDIPQEVINHIKSYTPIENPMTIQLGILIGLLIRVNSLKNLKLVVESL